LGLYILPYVVVLIERLWFYIHDIGLTHKSYLTPFLTQHL